MHWLKRAVKSVSDQAINGLQVHHHVQDGASTDGTKEWLADYAAEVGTGSDGYSFSFESASDEGMYHAINQGWDKTPEEYDFSPVLTAMNNTLNGFIRCGYFQ